MTEDEIEALFARVRAWPPELQAEAVERLLELEKMSDGDVYILSPEELADIDEGLAAEERGEFASEEEIARVFRLVR